MKLWVLIGALIVWSIQAAQATSNQDMDWRPIDCEKHKQSTDSEICLACNIHFEAIGEPEPGQYAVALVTQNRVHSKKYPDNWCEVVWETRTHYKTGKLTPMFSWTLDGNPDRIHNQDDWEQVLSIAQTVLETQKAGVRMVDITHGAEYYHADYVSPNWSRAFVRTAVIGAHHFYVSDARPPMPQRRPATIAYTQLASN